MSMSLAPNIIDWEPYLSMPVIVGLIFAPILLSPRF